jgi:hypothetical protein
VGAGEPEPELSLFSDFNGIEGFDQKLRADIDEAAWESLYSTVSRPFDRPEGGRIAVKVINHYGDEVLKVLEL